MTAAALSTNEMLAVLGSRALKDGQTVFTGVGAPMLATALAQRRHAPRLTMVVEGGIVGPQWRPGWLPISTNEIRAAYRAQMLPAITDIFLMAQRGFLDVGFIGGAQIDRFGNLNTSAIGGYARPKVRLPGSGGANDIASLCREVFILKRPLIFEQGVVHAPEVSLLTGCFGCLRRVFGVRMDLAQRKMPESEK